jgi:hypothetical protein
MEMSEQVIYQCNRMLKYNIIIILHLSMAKAYNSFGGFFKSIHQKCVRWTARSILQLAMDWAIGIRFPAGVEDFSLLQSIQTSSGA